MKRSILTTRNQQQRLANIGLNGIFDDFYAIYDLLPSHIEVNGCTYNFCLNRRPFGSSLSYSNKFSNYFIIYIENDDLNEAGVQMLELLAKHRYNFQKIQKL